MRNKIIFATLAVSILSASVCLASFDPAQWPYYKDINPGDAGLVRVALDDEVFAGTGKNLSDLRVIDSDNREIPYKIVAGRERQAQENLPVTVTNSSYVPGQSASAVLDLGTRGKLTNRLTIRTGAENFRRNVVVSGSDDAVSWNILRSDGYIFDYTDKKGNFKSQNTTVPYPDATWRYLKVEISDDGSGPVRIEGATVQQFVSEAGRESVRQPQYRLSEDAAKRITLITVDLGASGLPASKLSLSASGTNFNRAVYVSSSSNEKDWHPVGQGYVFRYATPKFTGENLNLNFSETNTRFLKLEIINRDNEPLSVSGISVHSIYRDILFQAVAGKTYRLFYGNREALGPEYDLEQYFQYLDVASASKGKLSGQQSSIAYIPKEEELAPLSERIPYLFPAAVVSLVLVLLVLVYRFFRTQV